MPSIFDILNPQQAALANQGLPPRTPSILDNADYGQNRLGDALGGMAQALIAAGQPSQYPRGLAEAFGAAGGGAVEGMKGSEEKYLKRALVDAQVQAAQESIKNDKSWREMFSAPGSPAATATAGLPGAAAGPGSYDARTAGLEGGKKNGGMVYNELGSGAAGPYQFMPGTWADVRAKHPELNLPETIPMDDTPQTRALHDAAHGAFKADNATALQQAGVPPTPDNLYLAHRFGSSGAMAVLRADPNKLLAEVLPISWQVQNPDMRGQTAGGFRRLAAERMQGVGGGPQAAAGPVPAPPPAQGDAVPAPVQTAGAGAPAIPQGDAVQSDGAPVVAPGGPASGPPVQLAQAAPPAAPPAAAPPPAAPPAAGPIPPGPAVGGPRSLQDVIQTMPPGVRQMVGAMGRKDGMGIIMKYADPETHVAIDTTTNQIVFAPKTDKSGRYVPVDVMKLDIERQNAASQAKQAEARVDANRIRKANEAMQPPAVEGGAPTPTPGFAEQKGAISGAEEAAKVDPKVRMYQAELAMKDHEVSQNAASAARSSNNNLDRLNSLLEKVNTGKGTETITDLKAVAKAAGFDLAAMGITDDVGVVQAAKALTSKMTLDLGSSADGALKGSYSDKDVAFLKSGIAGLDTTPEGRKLIIDFQKRVNQRAIDIANIKNEYVRSGQFGKDPAGMWAKVSDFANANPLFTDKDVEAATKAAAGPTAAAAPAPGALTPESIDAELARRKAAKGAK